MVKKNIFAETGWTHENDYIVWAGDYVHLTKEEAEKYYETNDSWIITDKPLYELDKDDFLGTVFAASTFFVGMKFGSEVWLRYLAEALEGKKPVIDRLLEITSADIIYIPGEGWYFASRVKSMEGAESDDEEECI